MITKITHLSIFVENQDQALQFYQKLGFTIHTDANFGDLRWLTLCLPHQKDVEVALILATTAQEKALIGKQSGAKPLFSVETDDCQRDYEKLKQQGVVFLEAPAEQPWGTSTAFKDLYGNHIYMCQPAQ